MTEHWLGLFPHEKFEKEDVYEEIRYHMDKLLEFQEHYGMLPPFNHDLYMRVWRDGGDGYKWEAEDETK
jgi:hypothetical protein